MKNVHTHKYSDGKSGKSSKLSNQITGEYRTDHTCVPLQQVQSEGTTTQSRKAKKARTVTTTCGGKEEEKTNRKKYIKKRKIKKIKKKRREREKGA